MADYVAVTGRRGWVQRTTQGTRTTLRLDPGPGL